MSSSSSVLCGVHERSHYVRLDVRFGNLARSGSTSKHQFVRGKLKAIFGNNVSQNTWQFTRCLSVGYTLEDNFMSYTERLNFPRAHYHYCVLFAGSHKHCRGFKEVCRCSIGFVSISLIVTVSQRQVITHEHLEFKFDMRNTRWLVVLVIRFLSFSILLVYTSWEFRKLIGNLSSRTLERYNFWTTNFTLI